MTACLAHAYPPVLDQHESTTWFEVDPSNMYYPPDFDLLLVAALWTTPGTRYPAIRKTAQQH